MSDYVWTQHVEILESGVASAGPGSAAANNDGGCAEQRDGDGEEADAETETYDYSRCDPHAAYEPKVPPTTSGGIGLGPTSHGP